MVEYESLAPHFSKYHFRPPEWPFPEPYIFHHMTGPDWGDPHDHPFDFTSHVISGGYVEQVFNPVDGSSKLIKRLPGTAHEVKAEHIHRIIELLEKECWTLCLYGPKVRDTRFWMWDSEGSWSRPWDSETWELYG